MKSSVVDEFDGFTTYCATSDSSREIQRTLTDRKLTVYLMNALNVVDKATFLRTLGDALTSPEVAPSEYWRSWDGAADDAWQCLLDQPQPQAAILIEHADALVHRDLSLFVQIVEFLAGLARSLLRAKEVGGDRRVLLRVVFFGDGPNFRSQQKPGESTSDSSC